VFTQGDRQVHSPLKSPALIEGNTQALHLKSTLQDLSVYEFQVDWEMLGSEVAQSFERYPLLPGVILLEQEKYVGMISRQCFLEYLLRPQGTELFLQTPLRVLHSYAHSRPLILTADTSILVAAQQALRRPFERLNEPILIECASDTYQLLDARELNIAYWQLRGIDAQVRIERLQVQMLQSEKMASLGRLVDGVSHEILDPVSFIWGNLSHVADYQRNLLDLLEAYERQGNTSPEIVGLREAIELDYIREDLPKTLESIKTGAERLSKLANSLQNFCHIDEVYPRPANLHDCLDSVLLLLKSRLKSEIQVIKKYGHLPPVPCFSGQLSQVLMNILNRAIDDLLDQAASNQLNAELYQGRSQATDPPRILITTDVCSLDRTGTRWISIQIADNSIGMSSETWHQLMQAFSAERSLAKETSLAMSYRIITARHSGKFRVYSCIDPAEPLFRMGTAFEILLPMN
jgi:signal transduction histidine kinase